MDAQAQLVAGRGGAAQNWPERLCTIVFLPEPDVSMLLTVLLHLHWGCWLPCTSMVITVWRWPVASRCCVFPWALANLCCAGSPGFGGKRDLVLAAFPLGDYVRIFDEREAVLRQERHLAFNNQSLRARAAIVAAGPAANLLLAVLRSVGRQLAGRPGAQAVSGQSGGRSSLAGPRACGIQ